MIGWATSCCKNYPLIQCSHSKFTSSAAIELGGVTFINYYIVSLDSATYRNICTLTVNVATDTTAPCCFSDSDPDDHIALWNQTFPWLTQVLSQFCFDGIWGQRLQITDFVGQLLLLLWTTFVLLITTILVNEKECVSTSWLNLQLILGPTIVSCCCSQCSTATAALDGITLLQHVGYFDAFANRELK